jgi:integrase
VNDEGEQLFPRAWNHEFLDLPTISKQKQPCATKGDVERAIKNSTSHQEQLLYAVLSGAGLRIAEALSIHTAGTEDQTRWDAATATIAVCSSIYNGAERHRVKTEAAKRVVDLDSRLNAAIIKFVGEQNIQPGAFLFQSRSGRAMHLRTATARLKKHGIPGFHTFRRFWTTRRRDIGVPEDIIRFWVGHAGEGITDRYSKLAENVELRKEWARRAGLGFELDKVGHPAPKLPLHPKPRNLAPIKTPRPKSS